jgi:thiol:disulfide interchange protein
VEKNLKPKVFLMACFLAFQSFFIYTLIGVLVAVFRNNFVTNIINHWVTNLVFFGLFVTFAVSFFGAFEIVLPSGFTNKIDRKADSGGLLGPFFMALTTAIVSFSCTGPIIGALLVKASQGEFLEPILGMFGFSFVFALPFTLFAIFPSMLKDLPKSGGWLNAVKVVLGFIILVFSLKFFTNAFPDVLNRELYLSIWIALFTLLGLYLLGKIKFSHDSDLPSVSVIRLFLSIATFTFAIYLLTGFTGNRLTGLGALIPTNSVIETAAISVGSGGNLINDEAGICDEPTKLNEKFKLPHGLQGYFDYEEGLACAKEQNKPLLLDFKGHFCTNCKDMEARVWSDPAVLKLLNEQFVIVAFYTDDKTKLPEEDWYTSDFDNKIKKTIGKQHMDFQATKYHTNAIPLYAIVDHNGDLISDGTFAYNPNVDEYIEWMQSGINNFK